MMTQTEKATRLRLIKRLAEERAEERRESAESERIEAELVAERAA